MAATSSKSHHIKKLRERRLGTRSVNKRIALVLEGAVTEKKYFEALKSLLKIPSVELYTPRETRHSDPQGMIEFAKNLPSTHKGTWDAIFCICDYDNRESANKFIDHATTTVVNPRGDKCAINVCMSVPSFEVWLLYHYEKLHSPIGCAGSRTAAQNAKRLWEQCCEKKGLFKGGNLHDFNSVVSKHEDAVQNSKRSLENMLDTAARNPSSTVHLAVEALKSI